MKIFVSSPIKSLRKQRAIIEKTIREELKFEVFLSERDRSRNKSSLTTCLDEVNNSDLFIILLGKKYGWISEDYNLSVTEIEYNEARKLGKDILAFKIQYFDREARQQEFINKVGDFVNGRNWGKEIDNETELRSRIIRDISSYSHDKSSEADKYVPSTIITEAEKNLVVIDYNKKSDTIKLTGMNEEDLLFLRARIDFPKVAGAAYLLKIKVNNIYLQASDLINKPLIKQIKDGRKYPWYNDQNNSWLIIYGPNYKDCYYPQNYQVINGDPYIFIFCLKKIKKNVENQYEIIFEHSSLKGYDAYRNSIIIGDFSIL